MHSLLTICRYKFEERLGLYCIVLYVPPILNPMSYDGARVLEASECPFFLSYAATSTVGLSP